MTPEELLHYIENLSPEELVAYLEDDANGLSFCFLNAVPEASINKTFERMFSSLAQKQLADSVRNSKGIQALYTHLAFYFRRINSRDYVDNCATHIHDNAFKKRLSAWLHYKRYTVHKSHISEFVHYLEKLSAAVYDDTDEFTYELLSDLHEYRIKGLARLNDENRAAMEALFNDTDLQARFPLLGDLNLDPNLFLPGMEVSIEEQATLLPTLSVQQIFEEAFLAPMRNRQLYGYTMQQARNIINRGQANFDQGFEALTAAEVVKLYCYLNMRMHYFSSWSLFERSALANYYSTGGKIKFIDIGCGPGTSGLAFATYIRDKTGDPAVFDYFGIDTSVAMQQQAIEMLTNDIFISEGHVKFYSTIEDIDLADLANPTCIIINACYVFASETLEIEPIATFIKEVQIKFKYSPKFLLYQNLSNEEYNLWANQRYIDFKALLENYTVIFSENKKVTFHNQRNVYGNDPRNIKVFFEILKL